MEGTISPEQEKGNMANGFPIFHKSYDGNISNIKILEDLIRVMAERGINTIAMDMGFYSETNVEDLNKLKMEMIVGVKHSTTKQNLPK